MLLSRLIICLSLLPVLAGCGGQSNIEATKVKVVEGTMFGNHVHDRGNADPVSDLLRATPVGTLSTVDTYVDWRHIEPQRGVWEWKNADKYINSAAAKRVDVLFNLYGTPKWASTRPTENCGYCHNCGCAAPPSNYTYWDEYVTAVAQRYLGKVKYYEIWNEPEFSTGGFFSGTPEELAEMHRRAYIAIKKVDPSAMILSASTVLGASSRLAGTAVYFQGIAGYTDIIGFHCYGYPTNPEKIANDLTIFRSSLLQPADLDSLPLWATEGSWCGTLRDCPDTVTQQGWATRMYAMLISAGIDRFIWYALNNESFGTQVTNSSAPGQYVLNDNGRAFNLTRQWLEGASLRYCENTGEGTWMCLLTRDNGYKGMLIWNTSGVATVDLQVDWIPVQYRDLNGNVLPTGPRITIDKQPILVENNLPR